MPITHTFTDPLQALGYFTECALATVEGLPKRTSQSERKRLQEIADDMVRHCRVLKVKPSQPYVGWATPRLNDLLRPDLPSQKSP